MLNLHHRACTAVALATALLIGFALLSAGAGAGARIEPDSAPARPAPAPRGPAGHPLVVLLRDHAVHSAPRADAKRISAVAARRPLTHVRTVLPVLERRGAWIHVRLPGRPNSHAGWISADRTRRAATDWLVAVSISRRLVTVFHRGQVEGRFRAVVGQPSTPTPHGQFFVEEIVRLSQLGAPYALAISARSNVYQQFGGGPGQVALHGMTGIPGRLGTAVSHGCLRLSPRAMRWLARRVGPGVPLTIRR
jgi:hypothetical protein